MSKWFIGFTRSGQAPEVQPLEVHSFEYGRELLLAMLSEASECALESQEHAEASALEAAINDVLDIGEPREVALSIAQYTYWLSKDDHALIQRLSDDPSAHQFVSACSPALATSET